MLPTLTTDALQRDYISALALSFNEMFIFSWDE